MVFGSYRTDHPSKKSKKTHNLPPRYLHVYIKIKKKNWSKILRKKMKINTLPLPLISRNQFEIALYVTTKRPVEKRKPISNWRTFYSGPRKFQLSGQKFSTNSGCKDVREAETKILKFNDYFYYFNH